MAEKIINIGGNRNGKKVSQQKVKKSYISIGHNKAKKIENYFNNKQQNVKIKNYNEKTKTKKEEQKANQ